MTEYDKWEVNKGDESLESRHFRVGDSSPLLSSSPRVINKPCVAMVASQRNLSPQTHFWRNLHQPALNTDGVRDLLLLC